MRMLVFLKQPNQFTFCTYYFFGENGHDVQFCGALPHPNISVVKGNRVSEKSMRSSNLSHFLQKRRFHASGAELVHPQRRLVLQRGAAWVEGVRRVVVQETAEGGHVEVGEARQASGEVRGIVARSKDAAELRVE